MVEFLLVNHPLDCPVCDKGGECPLQDISYGWGAGKSRYIEPKRHFKKPIELSPLIAIDRERCILCYRCVRFSQEVSEDYQLVFLERGDHTFVGTHDGAPYVGPFSGNIIELCPVGALTSRAYRFRARPWDIEGAGSLCLLCPSQCNVEFTVRDDAKILRVLARDNEEVDDGWLCDKGRFGYQAVHAPRAPDRPDGPRRRRPPRGVVGARAVRCRRRAREGGGECLRGGRRRGHQRGGLPPSAPDPQGLRLGPARLDGRGGARPRSRAGARQPRPARARTSDIDGAGAVLVVETELVDEAPILDLRVRKAARREGAKVVTLTSRPSSLDPNSAATVRFAPGAAEAALAALADPSDDLASRAPAPTPEALRGAAEVLREAESTVILWGSRVAHGDRAHQAVARLIALGWAARARR